MVNMNLITTIEGIDIMEYFPLDIIFILLYLFTMIVLLVRINIGIKQRRIINIQNKTIIEQDKLIELLNKIK